MWLLQLLCDVLPAFVVLAEYVDSGDKHAAKYRNPVLKNTDYYSEFHADLFGLNAIVQNWDCDTPPDELIILKILEVLESRFVKTSKLVEEGWKIGTGELFPKLQALKRMLEIEPDVEDMEGRDLEVNSAAEPVEDEESEEERLRRRQLDILKEVVRISPSRGDARKRERLLKRLRESYRYLIDLRFPPEREDRDPSGWQSTRQRSLDEIKSEIERSSDDSLSKMTTLRYLESISERNSSEAFFTAPSPVERGVSTWGLEIDSDLESIASVEGDIFSTAGSFSTNSSVSSIRFTVIELIVSKFVEDKELSTLYEEAIKRMPNDRFVRNQRRLLKKFFQDLRPYAKTTLQEQAIRILRGRRERTSIAEQIWSIINPSNASRHAQIAALRTQKPDKQSQLDRLLGGGASDATEPTDELRMAIVEQDTLSEVSEGSDSEGSGFANEDTKYPNVAIATEFLVGGTPFKQYKLNLKDFLRPDASPAKLQELVVDGDVVAVTKMLSTRFGEVAQLEFEWLHELLDIGSSFEEMATLLIDGEQASPWVILDHRISISSLPSIGFHQPHCVHSGGQKLDTAPRAINSTSRKTEASSATDYIGIRKVISELCGIAGSIPLSSKEDECEWMTSARFAKDNTVVWIRYDGGDSRAISTIYKPAFRTLDSLRHELVSRIDALERAYHAIGYLQETGICCDAFTILVLRARDSPNGVPFVELCTVDISLVESLKLAVQLYTTNTSDAGYLQSCASIAKTIISKISEQYSEDLLLDRMFEASICLNQCALAIQILTVGILSYAQGHTGGLHPHFLVDPLSELHLLGMDADESEAHIVMNLVQLTCIGDMLQKPVLVFRVANVEFPSSYVNDLDEERKFDLFASPESVADTWGPARFVVNASITSAAAESSSQQTSRNLRAVEVGGGTITHTDANSQKLHWCAGIRPYFGATFDSKEKILIGGVTVNEKCPLDEGESWRLPVTNAYLRHLGTHQGGWELQQKQIGLQGGQYAVLQFNSTYVKQEGVTLKQQQLMLPSNEIDLAFLNSTCGLQISFCTGVARRVALRELLADVMVDFVESKVSKPPHWEELKSAHSIVQNFRAGNLGQWFDSLTPEQRESAIHIVRSMLEVLKDTGIGKNDEELVIAWVRRESPYSCLRLRCEKTSLWARILADSEDCATFACITPLCLEIEKHKCRGLTIAPWHNVSTLLDTTVCPQRSNRELLNVVNALAPFKLEHQVSYWIGKSGSNLIAKVWLTNDPEPRLVVRQKVIPEKYRSRLPKAIVERLGRLREQQASNAVASQVVILAEMPY
ncbi:hypothetical protein BDZ45DRAFT_724295 [Acephala macrosclerotiorum]|nr:hypothetical protein BDZ45DRAFT_724295 [Acephala macrosclerotiorum]